VIDTLRTIIRIVVFQVIRATCGGTAAARHLGVSVGTGCRIYSKNFGSEPWLVEIGDEVTISGDVSFITHDGSGWLVHDDRGRRFRYGKIVIGNHVFVGAGSIILPGVNIGHRVVIGAGSVVTRSIPPETVVAGNPARIIMPYADFQARVLGTWMRADQMEGTDYRSRVNSVVEKTSKPILSDDTKAAS
jgi:acetyltransferase-like isoleucine patch superfamily enzyme